jgi:hypothetical protein
MKKILCCRPMMVVRTDFIDPVTMDDDLILPTGA